MTDLQKNGLLQEKGVLNVSRKSGYSLFKARFKVDDNPALQAAARIMHNRVRMVVASSLVKHLLLP